MKWSSEVNQPGFGVWVWFLLLSCASVLKTEKTVFLLSLGGAVEGST